MSEVATELLYLRSMDDAYLREFDARILRRGENYVVLDQTLFYPEGGGQEHDTASYGTRRGKRRSCA